MEERTNLSQGHCRLTAAAASKLAPDIDSATRPDQQIVEGIMAGRVRLYIYGYIRYRTGYFILGTGITGFCFLYRPLAERSEFDYELCPNHQYYMHIKAPSLSAPSKRLAAKRQAAALLLIVIAMPETTPPSQGSPP